MSRAPTRPVPVRATWVGKIALGLLLSVSCLETGYVLRADAEAQAGQAAGGVPSDSTAGAGGAAGLPTGNQTCEETFQSGVDFRVCLARHWGESDDDVLRAVVLGDRGEVWVGGESDAAWPAPALEWKAGSGMVARLDSAGVVLAVARVGASVSDLVAVTGGVVAATDEGLVALTADLGEVLAENPLGPVRRLAAAGSLVAALTSAGSVVTLDEALMALAELPMTDKLPEDIAIDSTGRVAVTGSRQPVVGAACQGRLPFIDVYEQTGELSWSAYGFDDAPGWCASSIGRRLTIRDERLFYAGEQEGGNSVHQRDPRDLSLQAPLVSYDDFSTSAGKAIDEYAFIARYSLADGTLETGQVIVPRDADRVGGRLFSSALAVDAAGRIFLGGRVSCCIEARAERKVGGQPLGPFGGEEPSLLILSPDLRERLTWTSFTDSGMAPGDIEDIAVGPGGGVLVGSLSEGFSALRHPADAAGPGGGTDGYVVLFPVP